MDRRDRAREKRTELTPLVPCAQGLVAHSLQSTVRSARMSSTRTSNGFPHFPQFTSRRSSSRHMGGAMQRQGRRTTLSHGHPPAACLVPPQRPLERLASFWYSPTYVTAMQRV